MNTMVPLKMTWSRVKAVYFCQMAKNSKVGSKKTKSIDTDRGIIKMAKSKKKCIKGQTSVNFSIDLYLTTWGFNIILFIVILMHY